MIDIHNHILPGVDDGSRNFQQSIDIFKKMFIFGINKVILTPHYISQSEYCSSVDNNKKLFNELKEQLKRDNIRIDIYLGNEIYVDGSIYDIIENKKIKTLNDSRYLLIEFPLEHKVDAENIIYNIKKMGYIPIIAHPERYLYYEVEDILKLINFGALLQGNILSYYGIYGKKCKRTYIKLLKKHAYSFISSDMHGIGFFICEHINNIKKDLSKLIDKDYLQEILDINANKVINDKDITVNIQNISLFTKVIGGIKKCLKK